MEDKTVKWYYRRTRSTGGVDRFGFHAGPISFKEASSFVTQWNKEYPRYQYSIDDPNSEQLIAFYTHTYRHNVSKMPFDHPLKLAEAIKQIEIWNQSYAQRGHSYMIVRPEDTVTSVCPNGCLSVVETSICFDKGTHYCNGCGNWFTPHQPQPLDIPPAESESEMKITVNRQSLIDSLQAELDKRQKAYDDSLAAYNSAMKPVQTLVTTNLSKLSESDQKVAVATIANTLRLVIPTKDSNITLIQQKINLLKMATDVTLDLEDNSPYLGWL